MEQNIAILIADLTGYTALTETHGPHAAADLIDTYRKLVNESLAGDCRVHQTVGDEVLIVSSEPDCILSTAVMLLKNARGRHLFLQLHGGLHYGKILYRNENYFGTTINLTARIASSAAPGTFYCSSDFIGALQQQPPVEFHSKGMFSFKNLNEEKEVFELSQEGISGSYIDPVCRMLINKDETVIAHPHEKDVYFCSEQCLRSYINRN